MGNNPDRVSSFKDSLVEALLQPLFDPLAFCHLFADQCLIESLRVIEVAQDVAERMRRTTGRDLEQSADNGFRKGRFLGATVAAQRDGPVGLFEKGFLELCQSPVLTILAGGGSVVRFLGITVLLRPR
jgi:hypothetical protein